MYGVLGTFVVRRPFISHSLSEMLSETGESFICISSTSIRFAARWEAVGMRDQTPRRKLKKNVPLINPTLAFCPLDCGFGKTGNLRHEYRYSECSLGHQTVMMGPICNCVRAALRDVPGDVGGVLGIRVIGSSLAVDAHAPQSGDSCVDDRS